MIIQQIKLVTGVLLPIYGIIFMIEGHFIHDFYWKNTFMVLFW